MRDTKLFLLIAMVMIITTSCNPETPTPPTIEATQQPEEVAPTAIEESPTINEGYPAEGYPAEGYPTSTPVDYTLDEGYPAPETTPFLPTLLDQLTIPTPEVDKGIIHGQLLTADPEGEPYYATIYLARTIQSAQEGYPPIVTFSEDEDPSSVQDKEGRFLFTNIPPGIYALAIWSPVSNIIIVDPDTQNYMLIEVRAGEITDLGAIVIP